MNLLVAFVLWAGAGVGVLIIAAGVIGRPLFVHRLDRSARAPHDRTLNRMIIAGAAALLALLITGWLVAALLTAVAVRAAPRLLGGRAARDTAIARTEAIAAWTEMVRDSIVAASGLEEAIVATGPVAPEPIAPEVRALVSRLDHRPLPDALALFQVEVNHPSADLVVASLVLAARMEVSDLSGLLSRLADAIRDDARMRIRVEVGRTRIRTASKVIVGVVTATLALLVVTNRDYLDVYDSGTGQLVLLVVAGIFATGGWLLHRMATIAVPERFSARPSTGAAPW